MYRAYSDYYPEVLLGHSMNTFAVDSEEVKGLHYAVHKGHFVVLMNHDVLFCPFDEIDDLLAICSNDRVKKEMKEIADDMIAFGRGEREYAKFRMKRKEKHE